MYTDSVLREKWRTQKELSRKANFDINQLMENAHRSVLELAKELKLTLRYSKRKGGYINIEGKKV